MAKKKRRKQDKTNLDLLYAYDDKKDLMKAAKALPKKKKLKKGVHYGKGIIYIKKT